MKPELKVAGGTPTRTHAGEYAGRGGGGSWPDGSEVKVWSGARVGGERCPQAPLQHAVALFFKTVQIQGR